MAEIFPSYFCTLDLRRFFIFLEDIERFFTNHYHVLFDRSVTWDRNMHIVAWVALESRNLKLQRYLIMQCIKESSTLRFSPKKENLSQELCLGMAIKTTKLKISWNTASLKETLTKKKTVVASQQSQRLKKRQQHCKPRGDILVVFGDFGSSSRAMFWEKGV